MDVLPRIMHQLLKLYRDMSLAQRATSVAAACTAILGFGWLVFMNQTPQFQAVSFGKVFAPDELVAAEHALKSVGLSAFRHDNQRLLVPAKDLDRCNAALLESDALPADLGAQMLKQFETLGPFSTDRQRQQMKEALLLQELRRMIKAVPDVEDARVAIANSDRRAGWNQKSRATANVSVKPKPGRELSTTLIHSLRHVIANMVPDLKPADVTIFDVTRGQAYTGDPTDDPTDSLYLHRAREFSRQYEQQIQKALSYIPNVNVTVHVDLDTLKSSLVRSETVRSNHESVQFANQASAIDQADSHQTGFRGSNALPTETVREVTEKQLVAAMPKAVQVCVSIPRDYLRDLINRRIAKGENSSRSTDRATTEDEELEKVERIVGRMIPANSSDDAISVNFVDGHDADSPEPPAVTLRGPLDVLAQEWITYFSIALFVIAAIWILGRKPKVVASSHTEDDVMPNEVAPSAPSAQAIELFRTPAMSLDRMASLREEVRSMVASDPVASATLLSRWLSDASQ